MPLSRRHALAALLCGPRALFATASDAWIPLFDGKSLQGWKQAPIHGSGKVEVKDGALWLNRGYMTAAVYDGEFPKTGYAIRFEAGRFEGDDFFASLTFPVGKSFCTWICGGWGGQMVGLSSLEGQDASENDTSTSMEFEKGRWYRFRLEVTDQSIRGWIDDKQYIDVELAGRTVALRPGDIESCMPLGFASYSTTGGVRKIEYRRFGPAGGK